MTWARSLMWSRSPTSTPWAARVSISLSRAGGWITTPLPIDASIPGRRIPVGTSESLYVTPSTTTVCPALAPPWYRTTTSCWSQSRSTIFPLASSPHCSPTTHVEPTANPLQFIKSTATVTWCGKVTRYRSPAKPSTTLAATHIRARECQRILATGVFVAGLCEAGGCLMGQGHRPRLQFSRANARIRSIRCAVQFMSHRSAGGDISLVAGNCGKTSYGKPVARSGRSTAAIHERPRNRADRRARRAVAEAQAETTARRATART